mgnify:FL=1
MNIQRRVKPGVRVKKFHNGGKGPGHPHEGFVGYPTDDDSSLVSEGWSEFHGPNSDLLTTTALDSILDSGVSNAAHQFAEFRDAVKAHEGGYQGYSAKQIGGGPGRGAYQFDEQTAKTAYKRLKKIANDRGYSIPELSKDDFKNMDQVDPEIQDLLFTAHFAKDTKSSVETVLSDKSQWADQWAKGHWKGDKKDYDKRTESFQHSLENMPEDALPINPAFFTIFPERITNE